MVYVGFGFLYTFLKAHSWASLVFNQIAAAWAMLTSMLWLGFWDRCWNSNFTGNPIKLSIVSLIDGDFCAAAVIIALGALLGKINATQTLWMSSVCACFYSLNNTLINTVYGASDKGGSMAIHAFGAIFGIAASWVYMNPTHKQL